MDTTVFADTCPYMTGSTCNVATLRCKNSVVPCNTSDTNARALAVLKPSLYFKPAVRGNTGGRLQPWSAGYDSYSFK